MKITFFCKVDYDALQTVEFYKQDLLILKRLGHEVHIATSYREIRWDSEIIFIWWWTYALWPIFVSKILRKRTIITGTFNYYAPQAAMDYFRRPLYQRLIIKYAMKYASINLLVSNTEYKQIKKDWNYTNLSYSPHVVDTAKYVPKSHHTSTEKFIFTIIWTGKQNMQRKCLPEIIETAKEYYKIDPSVQFIIAGRVGDGHGEAQDLIQRSNMQNHIRLIGEISEEDKIDYMQRCMIYLQPSRYEGFGLAIAEAMACGAVVLVNDAGEVQNVVSNSGVYLANLNPFDISKSIKQVLRDRVNYQDIQSKARSRMVENFSVGVREQDIERVIRG
jgi:glycosyltransferase involved in cell wall biosynthesis